MIGPTVATARTKRLVDIVGAGAGLVAGLPILAAAALAILLDDGPPVVFRQERVGLGGRRFEILKFRTMTSGGTDDAHRRANERELAGGGPEDPSGLFKDTADARVTRSGRWLRRFSVDELPQLVNVLRGDMSLVGPRPVEPWEVELFPDHARAREATRPGITGLWQVSGRNHLSMLDMLDLDCRYVAEWSLGLDARILLRTLPAVLAAEGAA